MKSNNCLEDERLKLVISDQLSDEDEPAVFEHLGACSRCQGALESMAAESKLWGDLPRQLASRVANQPGKGTEEFGGLPLDDQLRIDLLKDYLGPTDSPEMLGRVGAYEVCGVVGHGSTGVVVKALEPRLNRYVAIKILSPSFASNGSARRRFEREGQAAAAVSHEHVVPIYAVDEHRGIPYIVMQYIGGESLDRRIEHHGPLETRQVVRIGLQVASGLAAAHAQGVVHRDIKPANVLLENCVARVLVTDFGLARVADEAAETRSGVIAGTPQFMSPEQARGESIDERSDLFSLGSTMHAACTGHPPFRADTVFGVIRRVCDEEPRQIREINPDIPEWLVALIGRLMAKKRENRFESARDVADVLSRELAHLQNPTSVRVPDRKWKEVPTVSTPIATSLCAKLTVLALVLVGGIAVGAAIVKDTDAIGETSDIPETFLVLAAQDEPENVNRSVREVAARALDFEVIEERVFPAKSGGRLLVGIDAGHVELTSSEETQVKVILTRKVSATDENEARELATKHKVTFTPADGNLTVDGKIDAEIRNLSRSPFRGIKFQITVPKRYTPDIATAGGHITIKDSIVGEVRVKTAGGHLTLANVDGPLWAKTSGGHISVKDIDGKAEVYTSGGNLTVGRVRDSIVAETSGGNIGIADVGGTVQATTKGGNISATISKQPQANCQLITSGGNVRVNLSKSLGLTVEASTSSGKVSAPFSDNRKKQSQLRVKLNGGGPLLKTSTNGGNVHFEYLDADVQ